MVVHDYWKKEYKSTRSMSRKEFIMDSSPEYTMGIVLSAVEAVCKRAEIAGPTDADGPFLAACYQLLCFLHGVKRC